MSDNTARLPEDELLAEVAEEHGHAMALADDFDRIRRRPMPAAQPTGGPGWYRTVMDFLDGLRSPGRLAIAGVAALCVIVAATLTGLPQIREQLTGLAAWKSADEKAAESTSRQVHYEEKSVNAAAPPVSSAAAPPPPAQSAAAPSLPAPSAAAPPLPAPSAAAPPQPPAPAASAAPPPAPAATRPTLAPYVQVLSAKSENDARTSYRMQQRKYRESLGDREPVIRRKDVYYRAQVGPFANAEDAKKLCGALKAAGGDCLVITNSINP